MNSIPLLKGKYKPYTPTKLEARIDRVISLFAPRIAEGRMLSRERMNRYRYLAAKANGSLGNAGFNTNSGETQQGNRERLQLMWNSLEAIENSGLAWGIRTKMCDYICGTLRYQARTGVDSINNEYEDYLKQRLGKGMDMAGRKGIRAFARGIISGQIIKGDTGVNIVRDSDALKYQGIEADRIGNPLDARVRQNYIGGVHLAPWLEHIAYDIYTKSRMNGNYVYENTIPARDENGLPRFLLCANPITFDDIRGRTVFKNTLRSIRYLESIRDLELQALEWASSQSGVYYTKSGALPDMPFDSVEGENEFGEPPPLPKMRVTPNTVQALGVGEDVKMFQHDRPSPNVIALYRETVKDIALGCNLSFAFCYDMSGMLGGAVRSASNQDKRALITWKESLREDFLDPISILELGDGIQKGLIPPHPLWANGVWMFPPHPTIDVGRESQADINERAALLRSGAMIAGEEGNDIEDIRKDCSSETKGEFREAIEAAKILKEETGEDVPWREFLSAMKPGKRIIMSPEFEAARADQLDGQAQAAEDNAKRDEDLASGEGEEMP